MKNAKPVYRCFHKSRVASLAASCFALQAEAWAQSSEPTLAPVQVQSSRNSVLGEAGTANEGVVTQQ